MRYQGKRVALVVEGVPALADIVSHAITTDDLASEVVLTRDGVEALDYLFGRGEYAGRDLEVMPCVILLDLALPRLGGLEVLRRVRADKRTRLVPVVTLSFSEERSATNIVYSSGANSHIAESPESESLMEVLREVARYWCILNDPPPVP